jgi:FkbM family methyltransferase
MQSKFEKIKEIKKNITLIDFLLFSLIHPYKKLYNNFSLLRRIVKNWPEVILFRFGLKKEFIMELRNGKKVKIENYSDYFNFWENFWNSGFFLTFFLKNIKFDKKKKQVAFRYKNHLICLYFSDGADKIAENIKFLCREQFIEQPYKWLNVKGKEVVDVGAYIGDTPIYFAVNEAKHVYAFEPYPFSYKIAIKNIKLNKLEKRIILLNEAIGKENKTIYIDGKYENTIGDDLKEFKKGKKIKVVTLEEVVKRFKLKNAVLKMDCEGCEYPTLLNTPNEVLRNFEQIMLEYHYGYLNLKKKLEEAGFKVKASLPKYYFENRARNPYKIQGYLYAQRLSKAWKS